MKHCCGEDRETNFCPVCGADLKSDPLVSLLRYIRNMQQNAQRYYDRHVDHADSKRGRHHRAKIDKWQIWGDAVESVLKQ